MSLMDLLKKYKIPNPVGPTAWKEAGNALLQKKEVSGAVEAYTAGIQLGPDEKLLAVLLSNRSQAYLSLGEPGLALMDADMAIKLDPTFQKSLFRRGKALFDLERFEEAKEAFQGCEGQEKMVSASAEHLAQVERGEYNWPVWLTECTRDAEQLHDVSDYRNKLMQQKEIAGKGRGLVATEDLPKGTLLLVEKAAAIVFPSSCMAKRKSPGELLSAQLHDLIKSARTAKERKLVSGLQELSTGETKKSESVSMETDLSLFLRKLLIVNGFGWSDACKANVSQRPTDHGFGLWLQASMFNHSCIPNALYGFLGNVLVVRLARDVVKDEEICIAYCSCHDSLEERNAKLQRRGFQCVCELCEKQRTKLSDEFISARNTIFGELQSGKSVHSSLYWHGLVKLADVSDDFHVSAIVCRVVAVLSADRSRDFQRMTVLLEEAYALHVQEGALLCAAWQEEANFCIHAMFAAIALQDKELAEKWTPRLDLALSRFFPQNIVESMSNFMIISYRLSKAAEEKQKQGPSLQSMMGGGGGY